MNQDTKADIIAVPICGQVVMNIEQAKAEVIKLQPQIAIPIHYDNSRFPVNVSDFEKAMAGSNITVNILEWGKSISV